jgi:hypothetical protein
MVFTLMVHLMVQYGLDYIDLYINRWICYLSDVGFIMHCNVGLLDCNVLRIGNDRMTYVCSCIYIYNIFGFIII